jgi:hypothetical protein
MKHKDRKDKLIESGDIVAFDVPVTFGAADKINTELWDIFWGKAEEDGIRVVIDPVSQQKNVLYNYSEHKSEMLIIRRAADPEVEEMLGNVAAARGGGRGD